MNKSTNDATNDFSQIVSRLDVGKRVIVNKLYAGKLKYVGKVIGKDRIYCGIELDQPIGKHDGTYKNISYFECQPMHGIFAPSYKVQLEDNNWNKKNLLLQKSNKLIKSAIPSLTNNKLQHSKIHNNVNNNNNSINFSKLLTKKTNNDKKNRYDDNEMDWSLLSTNSSTGMENSLFSLSGNSYNEEDFMINSHHTYVVTDSDCLMLSDIEICDSNLLKLDEDDDFFSSNQQFLKVNQADSIILNRPSVDVNLLPVIHGSLSATDDEYEKNDEELTTPIIDDNTKQFPHAVSEFEKHTNEINDTCNILNNKKISTISNNSNNEINLTKEKISKKSDQKISIKNNINNKKISKLQKNLIKEATNNQQASSQKNERPTKKPRVSIKEMMKQSTAVATARQPKPLSKNQLIMERMKASIEAEKKKTKKEIKAKVTDKIFSSNETSPTNLNSELESINENSTEQENMTRETVVFQKPFCNSINSKKVILTQNSKISTNNVQPKNLKPFNNCSNHNINKEKNLKLKDITSATTISRPPLKPRQTHLQPFLNTNAPMNTENTNSNLMNKRQKTPVNNVAANLSKFPTQKSALIQRKPVKTDLISITSKPIKKALTEEQIIRLRHQLTWNSKVAQVLSVVYLWQILKDLQIERQLLEQNERIKADCAIQLNKKCEELNGQISVIQRERDLIEDKRAKLAAEYEELQKESYKVIENWKKDCKNLDEQLKESQKTVEQLLTQKNELLATLEKDESEKVQKLSSEVNSLKYVLDNKNEEVKKLRLENHELQFVVDTIPAKDCENQKLLHKVSDLKDDLKRQRDIQKTINQQLDECMRELKLKNQKCEKLEKENEMLRFKVQALIEANEHSDCENNARATPNHEHSPYSSWKLLTCSTPLSLRSKDQVVLENQSNSPSHLNSQLICQNSLLSQNVDSVMCKSLDSASIAQNTLGNKTERSLLSIYQEQGRRQVNTPTKIYAPDGTFEVNEPDNLINNSKLETPKQKLIENIPNLSIKNKNFVEINSRYCDFSVSEDLSLSSTQ